MTEDRQRPEIEFPCRWGYRLIGPDGDAVAEAARECVALCCGAGQGERDVKLKESRASAGGRYVSWSLELRVDSQAERDELFAALSRHAAVKVVI